MSEMFAELESGGSDRRVALLAASKVVAGMLTAGRVPQDATAYTLRAADAFHAWLQGSDDDR